jgi:hypothetical protein
MASPARARVRKIGSAEVMPTRVSREEEILKEFESFFKHHISAMTPSQRERYKKRSAQILEESMNRRASGAASTRGKEQSSLKAQVG